MCVCVLFSLSVRLPWRWKSTPCRASRSLDIVGRWLLLDFFLDFACGTMPVNLCKTHSCSWERICHLNLFACLHLFASICQVCGCTMGGLGLGQLKPTFTRVPSEAFWAKEVAPTSLSLSSEQPRRHRCHPVPFSPCQVVIVDAVEISQPRLPMGFAWTV